EPDDRGEPHGKQADARGLLVLEQEPLVEEPTTHRLERGSRSRRFADLVRRRRRVLPQVAGDRSLETVPVTAWLDPDVVEVVELGAVCSVREIRDGSRHSELDAAVQHRELIGAELGRIECYGRGRLL